MCCNYCYHFEECKKAKKTNPDCCLDCAEYEFCPFILGESDNNFDSSSSEGGTDMDIFGTDEI